jgi:hypothetical protein
MNSTGNAMAAARAALLGIAARYILAMSPAYASLGQTEVGLNLLKRQFNSSDNKREVFEAELYRLRGKML